jgi:ketosteroid isomerase-like protein
MTAPARFLVAALALGSAVPVAAQNASDERARVLSVVEAALAAISREDMAGLADLMLDEALTLPVVERDGVPRYRTVTREGTRAWVMKENVVERGFDAEVRVSGPVASVWLPYDFHRDGKWSHCGVDVFTLIRVEAGWRIASLAYTVEQPPACRAHPDGPPRP